MSYVIVTGCTSTLDIAAFSRWVRGECIDDSDHIVAMIKALRAGRPQTFFLGMEEARRFALKARRWGLLGVELVEEHDE